MIEPIVKEPTEVDKLTEQVSDLAVTVIQKESEIEKLKRKTSRRPSLGIIRSRFKGG